MNGDDEARPPGSEDRTVFSPATGFSGGPAPSPAPAAAWTAPPSAAAPGGAPAAPSEPRRIQVGDVLNHIFQVTRFIARGGMGEVFEGINVNSEERVAIKVILPHLAADPSVQAMFRKEARTLTRLSHPALVQYRVLAQEPQLGVFYIVTEFIEGQNLSDVLPQIDASPAQLASLLKRLAEGLAAAHALGAIHRDMSPDNVMFEEGRFERVKIIDFGIAKDLDASSGTIVGDGFAGKLNYVAPEQLGDFDRQVGPWTDVYSLGLVILAVARRKDVDMGGSLVDAVDKRRAGPDLSPLPQELRPVLERMLKANPAERARSMDEVLAMLADPAAAKVPAQPTAAPVAAKPPRPARSEPFKPGKSMVIGGGIAAVAVLAVLGYALSGGGKKAAPPPTAPASAPAVPVGPPPADPAATARQVIATALPSVPCTWLDLVHVDTKANSVGLAFRGVAGKPAEAQGQISRLLAEKGLQAGSIDFSDVSPIDARECGPLEAFRQIRAAGGDRLSVPQRSFAMVKLGPDAGADAGKMGAPAVIQLSLNGLSDDLALVGIEPSGAMTEFVSSRHDVTDNPDMEKPQPGVYRFTLNTTHTGWSGILMLTGKGPFDKTLLSGPAGSHGPDWPQRFLKEAQQRGWKAEMVWYRTVEGST